MNRRSFEAAVDREIASGTLPGERGAMVIVDLDHLKRVNDTLGRSTGDRVVADIAKLIAEELGGDQLLSRLDSDEYGLLIPGVGEAQALERAGSILAMIRARTGTANLTASAGVALVEGGMGVSATDLITAADIALHQAKEAGRDRAVIFTGEDRSRLEWVGHVRQAIEEGGLVLYSQPIIDMASGLACAEELLVRMIDPVSGRTDLGRRVRAHGRAVRARPQPRPLGRFRGARADRRRPPRQRQHLGGHDQRPHPHRQGRRVARGERRRPVAAHLRDHRDRGDSGDRVAARLHRSRRAARLRAVARRRRDRVRVTDLPAAPALHGAEDRHAVRPRRHRVRGRPEDRRIARRHRSRPRHAHGRRGRRQPGAGRAAPRDRRHLRAGLPVRPTRARSRRG